MLAIVSPSVPEMYGMYATWRHPLYALLVEFMYLVFTRMLVLRISSAN